MGRFFWNKRGHRRTDRSDVAREHGDLPELVEALKLSSVARETHNDHAMATLFASRFWMVGGEVVRYMSRHAGRGVRPAAKAIKHAMLKEYEGPPHGLFATHKKQLETDVLGFLKS